MSTVRREHVVITPKPSAHAYRDAFLADGAMDETGDASGSVQLSRPLLEPSDAQHGGVHLEECVGSGRAGHAMGFQTQAIVAGAHTGAALEDSPGMTDILHRSEVLD